MMYHFCGKISSIFVLKAHPYYLPYEFFSLRKFFLNLKKIDLIKVVEETYLQINNYICRYRCILFVSKEQNENEIWG